MPDKLTADLTGKVALVTGGSRGLGREMVLAFARCGADVVIASRKLDACEELAKEVEATTGRRALPYATNVSDWGQVEELADATYEHFGRLDVLVNNAGMSPVYDGVGNITEALYRKVIDVNLTGPFRLTAIVGERMAAAGGGSIIMVSSNVVAKPRATVVPYAAAKAGLESITIGFAHAFGPTVRVNCIRPGAFLTDISKAWDMESFEARAERDIFLHRGGNPEEIVGAALYFASDASSYTTGAILSVTGGLDR